LPEQVGEVQTYYLRLQTEGSMQLSLNGFSYQYLWPDLPQWSSRFTAASAGFLGICALIFPGVFLQIWGDKYCYLKRALFLNNLYSQYWDNHEFIG